MAKSEIKIPKVGDRVNVVLPERYANEIRPSEVIEVQDTKLGVVAVKVIGDFKDEAGKPHDYIIRNAPPLTLEALEKKVRGNTWHWPADEKK